MPVFLVKTRYGATYRTIGPVIRNAGVASSSLAGGTIFSRFGRAERNAPVARFERENPPDARLRVLGTNQAALTERWGFDTFTIYDLIPIRAITPLSNSGYLRNAGKYT